MGRERSEGKTGQMVRITVRNHLPSVAAEVQGRKVFLDIGADTEEWGWPRRED